MHNRTKIVLGAMAALIMGAGAAEAATAKFHTMKVSLPDGAVAHILYAGNVAPKVEVRSAGDAVPADFETMVLPVAPSRASDVFARMDRISAMMDQQMQTMMRQAALMQRSALAAGSGAPGLTLVGNLPAGAHVSYVSSTTDANGCTRTVSYSSDGSDTSQNVTPKLTRTASDTCGAAGHAAATIPASVQLPQSTQPSPDRTI